jgi:hypothetical protein
MNEYNIQCCDLKLQIMCTQKIIQYDTDFIFRDDSSRCEDDVSD